MCMLGKHPISVVLCLSCLFLHFTYPFSKPLLPIESLAFAYPVSASYLAATVFALDRHAGHLVMHLD